MGSLYKIRNFIHRKPHELEFSILNDEQNLLIILRALESALVTISCFAPINPRVLRNERGIVALKRRRRFFNVGDAEGATGEVSRGFDPERRKRLSAKSPC